MSYVTSSDSKSDFLIKFCSILQTSRIFETLYVKEWLERLL